MSSRLAILSVAIVLWQASPPCSVQLAPSRRASPFDTRSIVYYDNIIMHRYPSIHTLSIISCHNVEYSQTKEMKDIISHI